MEKTPAPSFKFNSATSDDAIYTVGFAHISNASRETPPGAQRYESCALTSEHQSFNVCDGGTSEVNIELPFPIGPDGKVSVDPGEER